MAETATKTKDKGYIEAIGRRKTSVARVRLTKAAKTTVTINGRNPEDYFLTKELQAVYHRPLEIGGQTANYAITAVIKGGGIHSQAEALAMGIARALVKHDPETKAEIKKAKLLTRDARMKERRKFGLKKARKSPQWSKR